MSDCPNEGADPGSSAKTNQGQGKNKKRTNSNRNKRKNARQQEANEAKEKAKVVPQTQDIKSNTSQPGNSAKHNGKSKAAPKSQDINKDHTSEPANQAKAIQKEMNEESIENNTIAFDTASSNGGTSQQESQNNSSEFYSATEEDVTITEPGSVDDIGETRKEEDLEINENKLINSDSLNEKHKEIEEYEQNQTIMSSPVSSEGPQKKDNLGNDASEEFNLNQKKEEFDSQKETERETNLENDIEIEKLQKGTVIQEEINLENETHNKSNTENASHEETNIEPEAKEDFKLETEKQKDSKLETQKQEEPTVEKDTQEEPIILEHGAQEEATLEKDTQEESTVEKDTQEESILEHGAQEESTVEKDTQEESTVEKDTQEESTVEKDTQEESTVEKDTQEEPTLVQGAYEEPTLKKCTQLEPCLENLTQEEINHENEAHDETNNKKGSHDEDNTEAETQKVLKHAKGMQESNEIEVKCGDEDLTRITTDMNGYKDPSDDEISHQITKIQQDGVYNPQITSPEQSGDTSKDDSSKNSCPPEKKSKKRNKSRNKSKSKKIKMTPSEGNDYDTSQKKDVDISSPTSRDKSALDANNGIVKLNIDRSRIIGRNRGIDGANNSCYMDATLFSFFYCTDIFDETLLNESSCKGRQTPFNRTVLTILRDNIVYSLRQGYFCPRKNMRELRQAMQSLCSKICGSFMDAEEFIFLLFEKSLNINEFIYYTAGTSDFMHQLFVEKDKDFETVQELFEKSMKNCDDLKLQSVPKPALILEMPRSNRILIHHKGIVPSLRLDLTNVMVQCALDSSQATSENSHANVAGSSSAVIKLEQSSLTNQQSSPGWLSFNWVSRLIRKSLNLFYCPRRLISNIFYFVVYTPIFLYYALWRPDNALRYFDSASADASQSKTKSSLTSGQNDVESCSEEPDKKGSLSPQNTMDLIAIICIRGCHYTSFVKCDGNADNPMPTWLFFDSMSGGGPEVEEIVDFEKWMKRLENEPENIPRLWKEMSWGVQRAITDSHICIYKPSNPSVTVETTKEK